MKYLCPFSGESYTLDSLSFNSSLNTITGLITAPHPAMHVSAKDIIHVATKTIANTKSDLHTIRIIHAALLNHTGLAEFHVAAKPSYATAVLNITKLCQIIPTLDSAGRFRGLGRFPKFAVSAETSDCVTIPAWIDEVTEIYSRTIPSAAIHDDTTKSRIDRLIERIVNSDFPTPESKAAGYATYVRKLILSSKKYSNVYIPNKIKGNKSSLADYAADILKADRSKVTILGMDEIAKLENIIIDIAPIGTAHGSAILKHIRNLKDAVDLESMTAAILMQWDKSKETALTSAIVEIDIDADDADLDAINIPMPKPDADDMAALLTPPVPPTMPEKPLRTIYASDKLFYAAQAEYIMNTGSYKIKLAAYEKALAAYNAAVNNESNK